MLWDSHMHTHFSGDSESSPESMIEAAKKLGLAGICFTDHLDWDYAGEPGIFDLDLDTYLPTCRKLAEKEKDITVYTGVEIGLQPHLADRLKEMMSKYSFDFVIGSSHMVHSYDPIDPRFFDGKEEDDAYREYFESIPENIAAFKDFDVYGHIDYVVRYGPNRNQFYTYEKFSEVIDEILRTLISLGKGIEINTGGFKYGLGHPNPTEAILKRYREMGGEIITIGADGHKPEYVAYDFGKVPAILREAGFQYYTVFKERKPEFIRLP